MNKSLKILIFSFIFAFALWIYINLNLVYSIDVSIPVEIQSAKSQALSEEIPSSIDVKVKGRGWDLIGVLMAKDLKYNLDISKFKKDTRIITQQFVNDRMNLKPNLSILEISPDTININFDKVYEKLVPVKSNISVDLKDGYSIIGNINLDPDSVTVQGASNLVNRIKSIPTEPLSLKNVNADMSGSVALKDTLANLIKVDRSRINYSFTVQLSAEKMFNEIILEVRNVPEGKEVLLIPPRVNIELRGGVDELSKINSSDISIFVEFSNIESDTLGFVVPEIELPGETNLLMMEPQKLQYIIKNKQ